MNERITISNPETQKDIISNLIRSLCSSCLWKTPCNASGETRILLSLLLQIHTKFLLYNLTHPNSVMKKSESQPRFKKSQAEIKWASKWNETRDPFAPKSLLPWRSALRMIQHPSKCELRNRLSHTTTTGCSERKCIYSRGETDLIMTTIDEKMFKIFIKWGNRSIPRGF